jgi:hypothetical protein
MVELTQWSSLPNGRAYPMVELTQWSSLPNGRAYQDNKNGLSVDYAQTILDAQSLTTVYRVR